MWTFEVIEAALQGLECRPRIPFVERQAAVALVIRLVPDGAELLLMRRIERRGDPWSDHVSLPGGRAEPSDGSVLETARRETEEEVGIDLGRVARLLGTLPTVHAVPRGLSRPLHIASLVFGVIEPVSPVPGPEAQDLFWLPMHVAATGQLSASHSVRLGWWSVSFPCWRFEGEVVWGLTYRILSRFMKAVARVREGDPGST